MRALGRRHDWAATALGAPEGWTAPLRTTVDLCLGSAFPTFVWWGPDLVQLYNDAALHIVRSRHPSAFGAPAAQAWSEVWEAVGPIARQVMATGEAIRGEDFPVVPDRDGSRATAGFSFAYSAVRDDSGRVAGLFITAVETTACLTAERRVREGVERAGLSTDFRALFESAPTPFLVLSPPDFAIVAANDAYLRATMTERRAIVGRTLFEVFPGNPATPVATAVANLRASLERALATRRTDVMMVQQYDIPRPPSAGGGFEERWWSPVNAPVLADNGEVALIIHRVEDVTEVVRLRSVGEAQDRLARDQQAVIDRLREANAAAARSAERARASEALAGALVAHLPGAAVFVVDHDLRYVVAEGEALITAGLSSAGLVGRTVGEALGAQAEADYAPFYRRALAGESFSREHDGDGRVYLTRGAPLRDEAGEIRAALAISTDITERRLGEEALRRSEERYRSLFDSIDEGFCVVEVLFDTGEYSIDYRFLETNPAFARQTGLADVVGRRMREIAPSHEEHWFETYGRVSLTGEPTRFEARAEALGRWYDVYAFRVGAPAERRVAILFNDIAARKHTEAVMRSRAALDAYRVALTDALRGEADPLKAQAAATRLLGDHLRAGRVMFGEAEAGSAETFINHREFRRDLAMPTSIGRHRWDDFGVYVATEMRAGRTLVVHDVAAHPQHSADDLAAYAAVGIHAYLAVPLVREERIVAYLAVNYGATHTFSAEEVALVEETAERTWAAVERTRAEAALRDSEAKYRTIFDSIDEGFAILEVQYDAGGQAVDLRYLETNRAFVRQSGLDGVAGRTTSDELPRLEPEWLETYARVARTGESERFEQYVADTGRWFSVYMSRVGGEGSVVVVTVFDDISERKRSEATLAAVAARDAFVVELADLLRTLSDPAEIEAETTRLLGEHLMVDRAYYVDVDTASGTARVARDWVRSGATSLAGEHRLSDFGWSVEILRRGECHAVSDTRTSPLVPRAERPAAAALGIIACAGAPLIKAGRLVGALCVTAAHPRTWHGAELELLLEVAERTWAGVERARAESALRASEMRYRLIVESASDYAILTTDIDGCVASWSPGAAAMLGWTAAEMVGQPLALIFVPEDRAAGAPERERAVAAERGVAEDVRWHLHKSGARVFVEGSTRALHDERGQLTGFLKVGQDVTFRRAIMEALRESVLRFRTLVENVRDYAIFLLDAGGIITEWTTGAQRVKGYTSAEVVGRHVSLFFTPEDVAAGEPARELAEAAETGRAEREGWRVCKGDERFWANEIATAVRDGDGRLAGFTMISRDLTDRRHAEDAAELVRAAADRDALRRRLVTAEEDERRRLSRELHDEAGQHLTALALGLQALSEVAPPGSEVDRRASELRMLAATLGRELHAVAVRLRPRALDDFGLEAALSAYAEEWARQSGIAADVHARVDLERLPDLVESALYRIVQEALSNVARHSGATRASIVVERRDGHIVTIVEDDGRGFEPDEVIGAPRAAAGLGLLGMRERAALLGGSFDIESAADGGTTLFVRIPLAQPATAPNGVHVGGHDG